MNEIERAAMEMVQDDNESARHCRVGKVAWKMALTTVPATSVVRWERPLSLNKWGW